MLKIIESFNGGSLPVGNSVIERLFMGLYWPLEMLDKIGLPLTDIYRWEAKVVGLDIP